MSFGSPSGSSQIGYVGNFVVGGAACMSSAMTTHPIDLLKVNLIVHTNPHNSFFSVARNIFSLRGLSGFYQGLSASLFRQSTYSVTRFGLYGIIKDLLLTTSSSSAQREGVLSPWKKVFAAMMAGGIGAVVGNPADVTLVRMQSSIGLHSKYRYKNVFHGIYSIANEGGILSLWKGAKPNVCRAIVVTSSQFGVYDNLKYLLIYHLNWMNDGTKAYIICSLGAGTCTAILSNPFDVIKTRIMHQSHLPLSTAQQLQTHLIHDSSKISAPIVTSGSGHSIHYRASAMISSPLHQGITHSFIHIAQTEGLRGFYRGFVPSAFRLGLHTICTFLFFENYAKLFGFLIHLSKINGTNI